MAFLAIWYLPYTQGNKWRFLFSGEIVWCVHPGVLASMPNIAMG